MSANLSPIRDFLGCPTPAAWLKNACEQQELLLIDHANCEKKAAATALNLLYRYVDRPEVLYRMSRLAREELRHFEQVVAIMQARGIQYTQLTSARYAGGLHKFARTHEPARLIDILIIGAFIEARSCERFACIAPLLDDELQKFYVGLLNSEARHFQSYLKLAELYSPEPIDERVAFFAEKERELIEAPDTEFRFHSGPVV
jgi:tRNA 2-(methylsulfanyl)-N6-isopentenyladenosine37 hydroxylase